MNTTEIQKIILKESKTKFQKEKKSSLLKLKKTREKSKNKINPLKSKKRIKKKIIFKKNYKNKNSLRDDISLETNSTIITLDEEPNTNNGELLQYLNEIELVMKDIYSKGIFFKNLKNFINSENGVSQIQEKNVNVKFLTENLKKCINSISYSEKMNLILDIDETLVFSKMVKELKKGEDVNKIIENLQKESKDDIYYIKLESNIKTFIYEVEVRKNMAYFFKKLSPFCNFYINTMAGPAYVNEVIRILFKDYGLRFSNINENHIIYTSTLNKKMLPKEIVKNENFLILDDNICAWEVRYIPSIIPIRKFRNISKGNEREINNIFYQYYLFSNKIYCFDEIKRPFLNDNKIPHCVETTENGKSQLYYICDMIIKSFVLSKILDIPIRHALHFFQNIILKDCLIYYNGYDNDFIFEMINLLGGTVVKDTKDATHIILNKNLLNKNKGEIDDTNKYVLDTKWIFDCFFNLTRCHEYNLEYKL